MIVKIKISEALNKYVLQMELKTTSPEVLLHRFETELKENGLNLNPEMLDIRSKIGHYTRLFETTNRFYHIIETEKVKYLIAGHSYTEQDSSDEYDQLVKICAWMCIETLEKLILLNLESSKYAEVKIHASKAKSFIQKIGLDIVEADPYSKKFKKYELEADIKMKLLQRY